MIWVVSIVGHTGLVTCSLQRIEQKMHNIVIAILNLRKLTTVFPKIVSKAPKSWFLLYCRNVSPNVLVSLLCWEDVAILPA